MSKSFFEGVGSFFVLRGPHHGGTCQNRLWSGGIQSTFKNWIVYLFFLCLDLARCIAIFTKVYTDCAFVSLLLYRENVSENWTWLNNNLGTEFFLHFEYHDFLTLFRITVALITYVMHVCEFRFTVSFVSFFSFYFLLSFYMYMRYLWDMIRVYYFVIVYLKIL